MNVNVTSLRALSACLLGALVSVSISVADPFDTVKVRTWESPTDDPHFPPELRDERVSVPWIVDRPSFAVAFSGGGTRSATATLGQLRALSALDWLAQARYIAANSGGTWTAVPYMYLPGEIDDATFLGPYLAPEALNDRTLRPTDEEENAHAMSTAIHSAAAGKRIKRALVEGDEAYADLVGEIFLDPFGLHDKKRFFTFHQKALSSILAVNTDLRATDFYTVEHAERPFLVLVGTLLGQRKKPGQDQRFLFEMTPLYVGVRRPFIGRKKFGRTFPGGGGYVEPLGYDSRRPEAPPSGGVSEVSLRGRFGKSTRYRFTLSDAIGISSAAPSVRLSSKGFPTKSFPELRHWAIETSASRPRQTVELTHGDGGDIDNLAVFPLLGRKVENLLVFINTQKRFEPSDGTCENLSDANLVDDLVSFFLPLDQLPNNVVFEGGQAELGKICETFRAQRAEQGPLVHCQRYTVKANPRQGVTPYEPSICWLYLERSEKWIERLDPAGGELTRALAEKTRPFDNFPFYKTFGEQGGTLIDLDRERVIALSNFAAWSVLESAEEVRSALPGAQLPARTSADP